MLKAFMVCPGFIDVHSYADLIFSLSAHDQWRYLEGRIRQGIAAEIMGNCGKSAGPIHQKKINLLKGTYWMNPEGSEWSWPTLGEYLQQLEAYGVALNVGTLVCHGTSARAPQCITFEGGGFVTVTVCPEEDETWIALVTQEWDDQRKRFASDLQ
jgi:N-acyl-D-aspartate/D-glutamate deacylase